MKFLLSHTTDVWWSSTRQYAWSSAPTALIRREDSSFSSDRQTRKRYWRLTEKSFPHQDWAHIRKVANYALVMLMLSFKMMMMVVVLVVAVNIQTNPDVLSRTWPLHLCPNGTALELWTRGFAGNKRKNREQFRSKGLQQDCRQRPDRLNSLPSGNPWKPRHTLDRPCRFRPIKRASI